MTFILGSWYGVDCTFDETGKDEVSYNCFGMNASRMNNDYTADTPSGSGIAYLYTLPSLAQQGIELVELYKNDVYAGIYANVDAAFAAMTDANGSYEVQLFNYSQQGPLLMSSAMVEHHISSTQTPNVKNIIIRGCHVDLGNGYYGRTSLLIDKALSLQGDVSIYDLYLKGTGSLNLKSQKLSCFGNSVQFAVPVTGSTDATNPSEIYIAVNQLVDFISSVRIHTLRQANVTVEKITASHRMVDIRFRFSKLEEFGSLIIGSSTTLVNLSLNGTVTYVSTDMNGNDIETWVEAVMPEDLTVPIATVTDPKIMNKLRIIIFDDDGHGIDRTDEYCLNGNNEIVRK